MKTARILSAAAVAALAGQAMAQPILDGIRDDAFYGTTPLWTQNQPTNFGDNSGASCDNTGVGSPGAVTTGVEVAIPLSALGNPKASNLKLCIFINGQGHDFVSNQVLPGMPPGTATQSSANLGEPRALDFSTVAGGVGGNQYFSGIGTTAFAPTIDGKITNTGFPNDIISYGALKATQTCRTGFGDSTLGTAGASNGSELDGVYAVVSAGTLHLLITGNIESNNNKLEIFIDTGAPGGQNKLTATNPANMVRMGDDGTGNGLKFDAGFNANYWIGIGGAVDGISNLYTGYVDFAQIGTATGYYCGGFSPQSDGTLANPDPGAPVIRATIDNSNILGVPGACPPPAGNPNTANGSEIDSVYGKIFNGKLYMLVTGNVRSGYTKLNLFFDVGNGVGQNRLLLNNPQIDVQPFADMCDDGSGNGLTFDAGFKASYWFSYGHGDVGAGSPPAVNQYVNALCLRTDGMRIDGNGFPLDYGAYDGGDKATHQPITFGGTLLEPQSGLDSQLLSNYAPRASGAAVQLNPLSPLAPAVGLVKIAYDNSNTAGVTAASAAGAAAVTTGLELEIDLAELACIENSPATCPPTSSITSVKVAGFVSANAADGSNAGYQQMSNQVLGGLPSATAPGGTRTVNFANITGNQFVTITAGGGVCYANCDHSTAVPILNANDFQCFLNEFASQTAYANCDGSTAAPVLNANDFQCFLNAFASGCP